MKQLFLRKMIMAILVMPSLLMSYKMNAEQVESCNDLKDTLERFQCHQISMGLTKDSCLSSNEKAKSEGLEDKIANIYDDYIDNLRPEYPESDEENSVDEDENEDENEDDIEGVYTPTIIKSTYYCQNVKDSLTAKPEKCHSFSKEKNLTSAAYMCLTRHFGFKRRCDELVLYLQSKDKFVKSKYEERLYEKAYIAVENKISVEGWLIKLKKRCESYDEVLNEKMKCSPKSKIPLKECLGLRQGLKMGVHPSVINAILNTVDPHALQRYEDKKSFLQIVANNRQLPVQNPGLYNSCVEKLDKNLTLSFLDKELLKLYSQNSPKDQIEEKSFSPQKKLEENNNLKRYFSLVSPKLYSMESEAFPALFESFENNFKPEIKDRDSDVSKINSKIIECPEEIEKKDKIGIVRATLNLWISYIKDIQKSHFLDTELSKKIEDDLWVIKHLKNALTTYNKSTNYPTTELQNNILLLCDEKKIIRSIALMKRAPYEINGINYSEIYYLASSPYNMPILENLQDLQLKGAGTEMIKKVIRYSRNKNNHGRISLTSKSGARGFYEKVGFVNREDSDGNIEDLDLWKLTEDKAAELVPLLPSGKREAKDDEKITKRSSRRSNPN